MLSNHIWKTYNVLDNLDKGSFELNQGHDEFEITPLKFINISENIEGDAVSSQKTSLIHVIYEAIDLPTSLYACIYLPYSYNLKGIFGDKTIYCGCNVLTDVKTMIFPCFSINENFVFDINDFRLKAFIWRVQYS